MRTMTRTRHTRHGLYHFFPDGSSDDCALLEHALGGCRDCLFACHIDRGDWVLAGVCLEGRKILDKEEDQLDHGQKL